MRRHLVLILAAASLFGSASSLQSQDNDGEARTRQLWDTSLRKLRTQAAGKSAASQTVSTTDNFVGVTLWRYRSSRSQDAPAIRMLVHESEGGKDEDYTPERCEANTALHVGQKIRLSIESARPGFLYVVDREQYADGSFGDAELIFPTLRTRHGDNRVEAGQVIDIPAHDDRPGLLTIMRRLPGLVGEELTIVVSAQPIARLRIGRDALPIAREQLAGWKTNWSAPIRQLEESGQAGKNLTPAEKAATERGSPLTNADALPQTMYQVQARPGNPLLVTVPLKIASN